MVTYFKDNKWYEAPIELHSEKLINTEDIDVIKNNVREWVTEAEEENKMLKKQILTLWEITFLNAVLIGP